MVKFKIKELNKSEEILNLYLMSDLNDSIEKNLYLYFANNSLNKSQRNNTWFGHNYNGNGNQDYFTKLNSNYTQEKLKAIKNLFASTIIYNMTHPDNPISEKQFIGFIGSSKLFAPKPKSFADKLSQGHDRDVPDSQLSGSPYQHILADTNYTKGFFNGIISGEIFKQSMKDIIDSFVVGFGGSLLLGVDARLNMFRVLVGDNE